MPDSTNGTQPPVAAPRKRTNSANRILTLLTTLKAATGVNGYRVFPNAMKLKASPELVELGWPFSECMAVISKMLADFEREVSASGLSDEEKLYHMECYPLVITAIAPVRMQVAWEQTKVAISDTIVTKLQGADIALRRSVTEQMLVETDLKELRATIREALDSLKESALPQELKNFIATQLIRVGTSLDEYDYRGLAGLQDALAGYLGSLAATKDQITEHTTIPQKRKLFDVLTVANGVMTLAHSIALEWPELHAGFNALAKLLG